MAKIKLQSVKFKKDYMMLSAFVLFFAIVTAECFLAIWLPWHLRLEHMWAEQIARQELIDEFDQVRGHVRRHSEGSNIEVASEALLISRSLESSAAFMHQNCMHLKPEQCSSFMNVLKRLRAQSAIWSKGTAYSRQEKISFDTYLGNMRGVKTAPEKKQ